MPIRQVPQQNEAVRQLGYDYEAQPKSAVELCNLCGGKVWVTISHSDRYGYGAPATSCKACSLTVLNPVMTTAAYATFYQRIYRPLLTAHFGRVYDQHSIQTAQVEYGNERAQFLAPYLSRILKGSRMLDIGGSTGVVAQIFKNQFNFEATIIDPAPLEVEEARKRGLRTVTGFVESYTPQSDERYDFIALFQTIDHLLDPAATLQKVSALLSPDGLFFVDIVDFRAAYLRNNLVEAAIKIDHPFYFTEFTTELFLSRFGFEIVAQEYARDRLHIGYLCRSGRTSGTLSIDASRVSRFFEEIRGIQNT